MEDDPQEEERTGAPGVSATTSRIYEEAASLLAHNRAVLGQALARSGKTAQGIAELEVACPEILDYQQHARGRRDSKSESWNMIVYSNDWNDWFRWSISFIPCCLLPLPAPPLREERGVRMVSCSEGGRVVLFCRNWCPPYSSSSSVCFFLAQGRLLGQLAPVMFVFVCAGLNFLRSCEAAATEQQLQSVYSNLWSLIRCVQQQQQPHVRLVVVSINSSNGHVLTFSFRVNSAARGWCASSNRHGVVSGEPLRVPHGIKT